MIKKKRIYEETTETDGFRVLLDRLWPRGISKKEAKIDLWLKDIAPSTELRKWFSHDKEKWKEFQVRYKRELKQNPSLDELKKLSKEHAKITLLTASKEEAYNHIVVLERVLKSELC